MSFMEPQILETDWIEIDTEAGITWVPADILPEVAAALRADVDNVTDDAWMAERVLDFSEATRVTEVNNVSLTHGFGARLSAPGYLDATEWSVFGTQAEAESYLEDEEEED